MVLSVLLLGGAGFVAVSMGRARGRGRLRKVAGCGHALVALFAPAVNAPPPPQQQQEEGEADRSGGGARGVPLWETDPAFRARRRKAYACLFATECAACNLCLASFILIDQVDGWQLTWRGRFFLAVGVLAWAWFGAAQIFVLVRWCGAPCAGGDGNTATDCCCLRGIARAARCLDTLFAVLTTAAFASCVALDTRLVPTQWTSAVWCMFAAAVCATTLAFVRTGKANKRSSWDDGGGNDDNDEKERPDSVRVEMRQNPMAMAVPAAAPPPARREKRLTITNPSDLPVVVPTGTRRTARQTIQPGDLFNAMWDAGEDDSPMSVN